MGRISGPLEHVRTPYVPYPLWEGRGNCFPWVFSARSGLPRPGSPFPHTEAPRDRSSSNTVPSPPPQVLPHPQVLCCSLQVLQV